MTLSLPHATAEPSLPHNMTLVGRLGDYYVTRRQNGTQAKFLGGTQGEEYTYYLFDGGKPVAYVATIHPDADFGDGYPGRAARNPDLAGDGLRVVSVYLDPAVRGKNVSVALYWWLLQNVCDYLLPDDLQTRGGVFIWKQLIKDRRFEVMIFNYDKSEFHAARLGAVWANVYKSYHLFPFVTLSGKADSLISHDWSSGDEDDDAAG